MEAGLTKPYYKDDAVTIYHGDCRDLLPYIDAVDLVLTDPPYGIGNRWASASPINGKNGSSRLWSHRETWDDATIEGSVIRTVINHGKQSIVWGGNYYALPPSRCWLIWDKMQKFAGADAELAWTTLDAPVRVFRLSRVEAFGSNAEATKQHPTEKPLKVIRWCISLAGEPTSILDPFMGSGTTLRVAKDLGIHAIGIETEERYCEIAAKRMGQEVLF